jgi:hypothetical protein
LARLGQSPRSHVRHGEALNASKREAAPKMSPPTALLEQLRPHVDDVVARMGVYAG